MCWIVSCKYCIAKFEVRIFINNLQINLKRHANIFVAGMFLAPETLKSIQLLDQPLVWQRNDCANFPMEDSRRKFYVKFTDFRNRYLRVLAAL